jgi:excisionase family DNA binding protein
MLPTRNSSPDAGDLTDMNLGEQKVTGGLGPDAEDDPRLASGKELLTVAEVSALLRVSKMTIYRMVHSDEITHVRVGRSFRIPADAVRRILGTRNAAHLQP